MSFPPLGRAMLPALVSLLLYAVPLRLAVAQDSRGNEFIRQSIFVTNFAVDPPDLRLGRAAGDAVRSKLGKVANGKELSVVNGNAIRDALRVSSYEENQAFAPSVTRALARHLRADEYLVGSVRSTPAGPQLGGWLLLTRDAQMRQPLRAVVAGDMDASAEKLAAEVIGARTQLAPLRRCENALRAGQPEQATAFARQALVVYPRAAMARACLLWAMRASPRGDARAVLAVARELLALDSANAHGLEAAAISLDSLRQREEAGAHWLRLAQTDTLNLERSERAFEALMSDGNTTRAEALIAPIVASNPGEAVPRWQWFRAAFVNRHWKQAVEAGENLLARDSSARRDSVMQRQLAVAYGANGQPVQAVETLARAVRAFPGDGRIYALYAQQVRAESDTVIPRGLSLFPRSADLLALSARDLRAKGKLQESLAATRQVVGLDSSMAGSLLMAAQLELDLGRPDSALVSVRSALRAGEDSATVAQFALAKGNILYRAASGTRSSRDFSLALRYLALSDSIRHSAQSRFLAGAAALGVAQAAVTEATALAATNAAESCRLAHVSELAVPTARGGLTEGREVQPEAAEQSLTHLGQLEPYVTKALATYCKAGTAGELPATVVRSASPLV